MSNGVYDVLKWVALVLLDAVGICYQALSVVWSLPYGDQVLQTCAAVSVCLGTLLGVSNARYHGELTRQTDGSGAISKAALLERESGALRQMLEEGRYE